MTDQTPLDEIGASLDISPTGGAAVRVKSRWASAVDRFWASRLLRRSAPVEAETAEARAISDARVKMIGALTDIGIERMRSNSELADRALAGLLPSIMRKQENKEAVLEIAQDDLRQSIPVEKDSEDDPAELSEDFLNRLERYAEDASEDEARARWGKVLASEVRKPGTFSSKALRVIDELDADVAQLFEKFCFNRLGDVIPLCLGKELDFSETAMLVGAGLIVDPGVTGHLRGSFEITLSHGHTIWWFPFPLAGMGITKTPTVPMQGTVLKKHNDGPAIPIYVLTRVGQAIASILPADEAAIDRLIAFVAKAAPESDIFKSTPSPQPGDPNRSVFQLVYKVGHRPA